jgi:N-acetylmuramic acid 6-phosphate etherase
MVDVKRSNHKLVNRARRIFRCVLEPLTLPPTSIKLPLNLQDDQAVDALIDECDGSVKLAMVAARWSCTPAEATAKLNKADGLLKRALAV